MTGSADDYHSRTSYSRFDLGGGGLDFRNQPRVFKSYPGLSTVPLPQVIAWPEKKLSEILRGEGRREAVVEMDMDLFAKIVVLTHALTSKRRIGGAEFYFRSVASAGALYPFELYAAVRDVVGLPDGLYHHTVALHALTLLRSGNLMPTIAKSVKLIRAQRPSAVFFLTSIFFRSSWKYRDRAYRYNLLDTGHLAENLMLALRALSLEFELLYDFDDRKVNALLGLDTNREVCLAVASVSVEQAPEIDGDPPMKGAPKGLASASRVAGKEIDYPLIRAVHESTYRIEKPQAVTPPVLESLGLSIEPGEKLPAEFEWPEVMNYSDAIFRRRSNRNFVRTKLSAQALVSLLDLLCVAHQEAPESRLIETGSVAVGFLTGEIEDLEPGFYVLDRDRRSISLVNPVPMIDTMTHVCLDQQWLRNCSVHFLFICNLKRVHKAWGPRGYRHALMTAGGLGQRLYVGATAMRIGCCGIGAFYDGEASELLGLNSDSKVLYLVAAGALRKWTLNGGND
jgi:SagB-type dehydrogenase family enzyme